MHHMTRLCLPPRIRAWLGRSVLGLVLCLAVLSGCGPEPDPYERRQTNAALDRGRHIASKLTFTGPLTVDDVVSFALTHNLDMALQERERQIQRELNTRSWFKLLPNLNGTHDYNFRNEYAASRSVNLKTGEESLTTSYSGDKESKRASVSLVWNLLDFGMSYYMARQEGQRLFQTDQQIRRTRQNLALNTTRAYWTCAVLKKATDQAAELITRLEERQEKLEARLEDKTLPQREGLQARKEMMLILKRLHSYEREYQNARLGLVNLMGLPADMQFEIADVDFPLFEEYDKYSAKALVEEAVLSRPELYREDAEERISQHELRLSLMRMLPSPSLLLGSYWDDNPFIYASSWQQVGVSTAWNLFSIPEHLQTRKAAKLNHELVQQRRMALAVGVVSQVYLSLVDYHQAAEGSIASGEIMLVHDDLVGVTESLLREGKANEADLLTAEIERFFATVQHMQSFADFQASTAKLKNTVGRDPELASHELPVQLMADVETGEAAQALWKRDELAADLPEDDKRFGVGSPNYKAMPAVSARRAEAEEAALGEELRDTARALENRSYTVASEAKETLVKAGLDGAAAALEILNSTNRRARILAILVIREAGDEKMVASLLPALSDPDPQIRYHAGLALKEAFNQDFGYYHNGSEESRTDAVKQWKDFLFQKEQEAAQQNQSAAAPAEQP